MPKQLVDENHQSLSVFVERNGGNHKLHNKLAIDKRNIVWEIINTGHGCAFKAISVEAEIPYWTHYFVELPGLRLIDQDPGWHVIPDSPLLIDEVSRLECGPGDLVRDQRNGLLWVVRFRNVEDEKGERRIVDFEGYDDNHWLPDITLRTLSFGSLDKLSTEEQRKSRRCEYRDRQGKKLRSHREAL